MLALAMLSAALVGCADRAVERVTSPGAVGNFEIPGEGDPTYYSANVNTTYYGGYPGYDNPNAARSAVYTEEFIWSSSSSFWDIRESFSSQHGPFGAEDPSEPGVGQALLTSSDLVAYNRAGQMINQPDTTLPLTPAPPDAGGTMMVPPTMGKMAGRQASNAASASRIPENAPGRDALDGRVVTPAAAARTLAKLRKTAKEVSSGPGKIDFEIRRGSNRSLLTFSTEHGAVTHTRVEDADGTTAETDHKYTPVPGGFVLTEEQTTVHLANAPQPIILVRKYSDTSIR